MVITNNLVLSGSNSPSSLSHQEKVRPPQSGPAWAAGVKATQPTTEFTTGRCGISEISPTLAHGSRTATLSGRLYSLHFSEEGVEAERGHGWGPARVAAVTQGGALQQGRLASSRPALLTGPNPQGEAPLAREAKRTQACPLLRPNCCLFLHLLVPGSCSLHLP